MTQTITSRTQLGYGWSNTPARDGYCGIDPDTEPSTIGTIRQCNEEHQRTCRLNGGGTVWTWSLYIHISGRWVRLGRDKSSEIMIDRDASADANQPWSHEVDIEEESNA